MARLSKVESRHERRALARDAGLGSLSFVSVLAGVLTAYGAVALLAALASGVAAAAGVDTDFTRDEWRQLGTGAAAVLGVVLFLSYLFGGYVAGRMARRAGVLNGLGVFVLGVLIVAVAGGLIGALADTDQIVEELRDLGVPTTADQWSDIGTVAGIASLAAMLLGAALGGSMGERWHAKLLARAVDPAVGPDTHVVPATRDDRSVDLRDRDGDGVPDDERTSVMAGGTTATGATATGTHRSLGDRIRRVGHDDKGHDGNGHDGDPATGPVRTYADGNIATEHRAPH